jgi:hypothetical protein
LANRQDGEPIVVSYPDHMIGKAALLKALDLASGYKKPPAADLRADRGQWSPSTSPRPQVVWGDPTKDSRRKPGGTRSGPEGGKRKLSDPETRWPKRLRD